MNILAFVLAGGEGARLRPLTTAHAKPALPFVNGLRIIDFVLSNLFHSDVRSIYVLAQYKPQSLIEHLHGAWMHRFQGNGRFLKVVCPNTNHDEEPYKGTADAVRRNLALVEEHDPDLVAVFAADHVYGMDIRQMAAFHRNCNANVCVAAVPVPLHKASAFGVMRIGEDGGIREFQEKPLQPSAMPTDPARASASMGNYTFDPVVLADLLDETNRRGGTDFGRHVMPHIPGRYRTFAYDFAGNAVPGVAAHEERGYWRDVGTVEALVAAQEDTLGPQPPFDLRNPAWPILGREQHAQTRKDDPASISSAANSQRSRRLESVRATERRQQENLSGVSP